MAAKTKGDPAPSEQIVALARSLESGSLPRAVLVRGEERYFRSQAVERILGAARALSLELARHDAQDPDFDLRALCEDLAAPSMFAAARCILVRNAAALLKKDGGEDAPFVRAAQSFLPGRLPGLLVIEAESLRLDSVLAKAVVAAGGPVLSLRRLWDTPPPWAPDPRRTELVLWLLARAKERRIELDAEQALYVAAATGNDLFALDGALERLERRGSQSVRSAVGWSSSASPFQVAEDLCRGDAARAVAGLEALFRGGFEERDGTRETDLNALLAVLFGALRSKVRQGLTGARVMASGGDLARAIEAAGVSGNPKARAEFEARLSARPAAAWRALLLDLAELERASRSGRRVDASDLVLFALRWARPQKRGAG